MLTLRDRLVVLVGFTMLLAGGACAKNQVIDRNAFVEQFDRLEQVLSGAEAEVRGERLKGKAAEALEIVRKIRTEIQELAKGRGSETCTEVKMRENELAVIRTL